MTTEKQSFIVTPKFRLSFPALFTPSSMSDDQKKKYSITMLFPKDADLSKLKALVKERAAAKWGTNIPKNLTLPFNDGNEKSYEGYAGCVYVKASSTNRPGVVDRNLQPILDTEDIYPGCWCVASLTAYAWEHRAKTGAIIKQGISFGLRSVMKVADGPAFIGTSNPEEEFKSVDIPEDTTTKEAVDEMFDM